MCWPMCLLIAPSNATERQPGPLSATGRDVGDVQLEPVQPASYGALATVDVVLVKQLMSDAAC